MKITIYRGQHQIGGSIIEVATKNTRIILDVGMNLDEETRGKIPDIEGLFSGKESFNALFVSHYHFDHSGLLNRVIKGIPIYMGENAYNVLHASNEYRHIDMMFKANYVLDKVPISIGDIRITPFKCDHSAYDSYMFLIEAHGKSVLYTGDFRGNGRGNYQRLLECIPQVDVLIVEGTTLSREEARDNIEEETLEDIAVKAMAKRTGPCFVLMSAMNIDRLVTMYQVAKNTNRVFMEDIYTALVGDAAGTEVPNPKRDKNIRVFVTDGNKERHEKLNTFGKAKIGRSVIANQKYVMCIRPSMMNYLKKLNDLQSFEDGILFYGMWKGYQEKEDMKKFLDFMKGRGVKIHTLHTSGHADSNTIERLIEDVKPKVILPVHTENETWFDKYKNDIEIVYNSSIVEL